MKKLKELSKFITVLMVRVVSHILCFLPMKKKQIIFFSQNGNQYSCNPKYISEQIEKDYPRVFERIWAFNQPEKFSFLKEQGIKLVRYRSIAFYYYFYTSGVNICNVNASGELFSRKGQIAIQTWHGGGGGYKKSNSDDKTLSYFEQKRLIWDNKRYTIVIASSETNMKNTAIGAIKHKGIIIGGTPRNDILVNGNRDDLKLKVREYYHLCAEDKIVLYAPTWRKDRSFIDYDLDFNLLSQSLKERFGGNWKILVRLHHMVKVDCSSLQGDFINASSYHDMQELLYASDVLISDYSSSIWDFSFTCKPCFLFCSDLSSFTAERDFYIPIRNWGFPVCESNQELKEEILNFNEKDFIEHMIQHHEQNHSFENGYAAENICKLIYGLSVKNCLPEELPYKQLSR